MRALIVLACVLALAGCKKRIENPDEVRKGSTPAEEYYPLAVGNSWTYQSKYLGQEQQLSISITDKRDGYFQFSDPNTRLMTDAWGVRDEKRYLLRDPVTVGEEWSTIVSVSSMERYRIIEAGQICNVPAGTFQNCVRVEGRNRVDKKATLVNEMTFAQGVGVVRIKTLIETADGQKIPQAQMELTNYELKGQKAAP